MASKKETVNDEVMAAGGEAADQKEHEARAAALAPMKVAETGDPNMERVTVMVPIDPLNPMDDTKVVILNGYAYRIKRGVAVEVPKAVVEILRNAQQAVMSSYAFQASVVTNEAK